MNKTALKNFATWSRRKLIEQVQTKAFLYGIDEKNGLYLEEQFGQLLINGQTYPLSMKPAFTALQKQLEQKGYKQLLEEAAYTWFNRIIAIRYMEVNEYLPERVNVLSSSFGRVDPDILFEYDTMDLTIKQEEVRELVNAGNTEAAFRILFVAQCNALNRILPFMFEPIQDYTELLLPDFLLDAESVIKTLVQNEELTKSFMEIEVIGWLYQYYIAEEKDRVFAQKSKYKKEEIPFATQLFTPKWIVQYMVQNSLGRYWTEAHREDEDLINNWEYFIKHRGEEDFYEKIAPYVNKELKVEDIKLLDPAMGSGHILVYAFEVFHEIYVKCGYPDRDIPRLILENNLYGLDIDDRAYQLAAFAVVMKAASYSKRFLRSVEREGIQLNLASIQETNHISEDVIAYITQQEVGEQYNQVKAFFDQYHNAKTYGSLINITEREIGLVEERLEQIENNPVEDLFYAEQHEIAKQVLPALIHQTKIMRNEYDVVVMNPPYMGSGSMSKELGNFIKKRYPDSKSDLYAAFMEVDHYLKKSSFYATINQHSWMFLSSYKNLRLKILENKTFYSMLHLGPKAFEDIGGEVVQTTTFILKNIKTQNDVGDYIRLTGFKDSIEKKIMAKKAAENTNLEYRYKTSENVFKNIPGNQMSYWVSDSIVNLFKNNKNFKQYGNARVGLDTGDNNLYIRFWFEVNIDKTVFDARNKEAVFEKRYKWVPHTKGGSYRKWYGNLEHIITFDKENYESLLESGNHLPSREYYFLEGFNWSRISSSKFGVRYTPVGTVFNSVSPTAFTEKKDLIFFISLMNTKVISYLLQLVNPTLHFEAGNINVLPIKYDIKPEIKEKVEDLGRKSVVISKNNWNSFEVSWDFLKHPLLDQSVSTLGAAFKQWSDYAESQFIKLKESEEELNRLFIDIYGLQDELTPEVDGKDITIRKADLAKDVRSFLSYFVGCTVGRYSLDTEGLAYAGGEWEDIKYNSFKPNSNGIIHLTESTYFEHDIIARLREYLAVAFAIDTVEENLQWLAEALVMKNGEDAETRLRSYFMNEFFADHCKMYQKRPIYWLVDSGKQKGLRTLIYMHRYQPNTMATIRFEYLQVIQAKYQQDIADLENRLVNPNLSATDKKKLNAEKVSFEKKIEELREFDKRLAAIAAEEIEIDLDDGVKVNYEKFYRGGKGVLAKIK